MVLSREILEEALQQAKKGRMQILDSMLATIQQPREQTICVCSKNLNDEY